MTAYLWLHKVAGEWSLMSWEGKVLTTTTLNSCEKDMPKILASEFVPSLDFDQHVQNTVDGVYN